jgi:predicted metal-dependent hydrolase
MEVPMPQASTLQVRNLRFALDESIPRFWHAAGRSVTTFYNQLSILFPAGERFFVASVKAQRQHLCDPELQRQVRLFCGQEGVHAREHVEYNAMLRGQGYPIPAMERRVERILGLVARVLTLRGQLAATCALEHFTATLGELLLSDPRKLADAHPTMAALWRWHSAEEIEHRAVAFDVYKAVGGGYLRRAVIMLLATIIFWAVVILQQAQMMHADRMLFSIREWRALIRYLFIKPGGMGRVFRLSLHYYRPDFHPQQRNLDPLVQAWQTAQSQVPA